MYERFFEFVEAPFNQTPDPRFFFSSSKHEEAFAHVLFGIRERKGFIVVTGEVGTGKTTLCRVLLDKLDRRVRTSLIFNPSLTTTELLQTINQDFGLPAASTSKKELLDELNRFLLDILPGGGNAALLIDEAQALSIECLEEVRMLSNLETDKEKLLQIVLLGQPELSRKLALPELRQLNQRVALRSMLEPLDLEQTRTYISHRLQVAGGSNKVLFTPAAVEKVHKLSRGIPRLINSVCDKALLAGFVKEARVITDAMISDVEGEMSGQLGGASRPRMLLQALMRGSRSIEGLALLGLMMVMVALIWRVVATPGPEPVEPVRGGLLLDGSMAGNAEAPTRLSPEARQPPVTADAVVRVASPELAEKAVWVTLLSRWGRLPDGAAPATFLSQEPESLIARANLQRADVPFDLEVLERLDLPAYVAWAPQGAVSRPVALVSAGPEKVTVLDPLEGTRELGRPEFLRSVGPQARVLWQPLPGIAWPLSGETAPESVAELQRLLQEAGLYEGAVDGRFGPRTTDAVARFQEKAGFPPTGSFDAITHAALAKQALGDRLPSLRSR
jgi:general secretion pathway protein A